MSLPYETSDAELTEIFAPFGTVLFAEHKKEHATKKPRGFGFLRFKEIDAQRAVLQQAYFEIGGRRCQVKIPFDKVRSRPYHGPTVGALDEHASGLRRGLDTALHRSHHRANVARRARDGLRGGGAEDRPRRPRASSSSSTCARQVKEVYIPRPFRSFAFVTFNSREIARRLLGKKNFIIGDNSVFVNPAEQRKTDADQGASSSMQGPHAYGYGTISS